MGMEEKVVGNGLERAALDFVGNTKNKYRRMDSDLEELDIVSEYEANSIRKSNTRKYVMASAIFASLNSVLLGYGTSTFSFFCFLSPLTL